MGQPKPTEIKTRANIGQLGHNIVPSWPYLGPPEPQNCALAQAKHNFLENAALAQHRQRAANIGPIWAHLDSILGPSWLILGPSWPHLGPSWPTLASSWRTLAPSWPNLAHIGPILADLGPSWLILASSGPHLGTSWAHLCSNWLHLGLILAHLGLIGAPKWCSRLG